MTAVDFDATPGTPARSAKNTNARHRRETIFKVVGLLATLVGLVALAALVLDLAVHGLPRLSWDFFLNFPSRRASGAGILSAWVGSLLVIFVTALIGVPLGVAAGVYLEEYARKNILTNIIEINVSNLAGVPSIIYGLLALGLFVYQFGTGRSIFTAGLTLALLILPIVIVATREAIRAVPNALRDGALALGATKWQVTRDHVYPASLPGILTGVIIGVSRALGETAPLITIGAVTFVTFAPDSLSSPFTVLPIQIFNWVSRPQVEFQANAAAGIIVLLALLLTMNAVAVIMRDRYQKKVRS